MEEHEEHLYKRVRYTKEMITLAKEIKHYEKEYKERLEQLESFKKEDQKAKRIFLIITSILCGAASIFSFPFLYTGDIFTFFTSLNFIVPAVPIVISLFAPTLYDEFMHERYDWESFYRILRNGIRITELQLNEKKSRLNKLIQEQINSEKTLASQKRVLQEYKKSILGENYDEDSKNNALRNRFLFSDVNFEDKKNSKTVKKIAPAKEEKEEEEDINKKVKRR